jgi:uncharacterized protein YaaN involved in tellurite resistance
VDLFIPDAGNFVFYVVAVLIAGMAFFGKTYVDDVTKRIKTNDERLENLIKDLEESNDRCMEDNKLLHAQILTLQERITDLYKSLWEMGQIASKPPNGV